MPREDHLMALKAKHADIDHLIEQEEGRPLPDSTILSELKRQKLRIKDEIAHLSEPLMH